MSSRLTRRQLSALLITVPAAAQVTSKIPPQGAPAPPPAPATPEERARKAVTDVRDVSDRLSKIEVPMSLEPAFAFRA